jgi:hypothetical protein
MKVAVFRRFAVMRHWISSGHYKIEDIISNDGLHMNDVSYSCIARLMADSVVTGAELGTPIVGVARGREMRADDEWGTIPGQSTAINR